MFGTSLPYGLWGASLFSPDDRRCLSLSTSLLPPARCHLQRSPSPAFCLFAVEPLCCMFETNLRLYFNDTLIKKTGLFSVSKVLYMFWTQVLCQKEDLQTFSPGPWLVFSFS